MNIEESIKKLSKFLRVEGILFTVAIVTSVLVYVFVVQGTQGFEEFGAAILLGIVIYGCSIILSLLALINLIKAVSIKRNVDTVLKQNVPVDPQLLVTFKRRYRLLIVINTVLILPLVFLLISKLMSIPTREEVNADKIKRRGYAEDALQHEPIQINKNLKDFKVEIIGLQNQSFLGFGEIVNNGNCAKPKAGSLFNPGKIFKPKQIISPSYEEDLKTFYIHMRVYLIDSTMINNFTDTRCFSNSDHFAYQIPSYYEAEYPKFYCIDDIHQDVIVNKKQIVGPSCESVDQNYVAPNPKPTPDNDYYKLNL